MREDAEDGVGGHARADREKGQTRRKSGTLQSGTAALSAAKSNAKAARDVVGKYVGRAEHGGRDPRARTKRSRHG